LIGAAFVLLLLSPRFDPRLKAKAPSWFSLAYSLRSSGFFALGYGALLLVIGFAARN
jgi:hypothetical protein